MDIQLSSIRKKKKRKRNSHFKFSIVQTCASKFLAHFIAPPTILRKTKEKVTEKEKEEKSTKLKVECLNLMVALNVLKLVGFHGLLQLLGSLAHHHKKIFGI